MAQFNSSCLSHRNFN